VDAEAAGRSFLYRTGPSFVRALAGLEPHDPLTAAEIWPAGHPGGHGLVVVGSHVGLTSRQVAVAQQRGGLTEIELDVQVLTNPSSRQDPPRDIIPRGPRKELSDDDVQRRLVDAKERVEHAERELKAARESTDACLF
jgi:hypothetical protein